VADHALALLLATLRDVPRFDAAVRAGQWRDGGTTRPSAYCKRVGIPGLGGVGRRIAKRRAGFDMDIRYHNRRAVPDVAWTYVLSVEALCARADVLSRRRRDPPQRQPRGPGGARAEGFPRQCRARSRRGYRSPGECHEHLWARRRGRLDVIEV
jgi:hypothetical protein